MNIKYKLGEVAKDLNKPNKEVIELLSKYTGEPRKSVSVLSEDELNYVFEYYTQKNQLENINDYFTATSKPPQPKQEKAPAPAKKKPAGEKGEKKEKAPEKQSASQPAPAKKKEEKPAQKPAAKKQPEKPVTTGKEKQEPKAKFDASRFETVKKRTEEPQPKNNKPAAKQKPKKEAPAQNFNTNMGDSKNFEQQMRHVDTSKMEINLDKYNEKYDRIAPSNSTKQYANATRKQKFANKNAQRQKAKYSNKRETEAQKLQRLELERARKQQLKVLIPDEIVVSELASRLKVNVTEVIKKLMMLGVMASQNETIDFDTASLVAEELGAKVEKEVIVTIEERLFTEEEDKAEDLQPRCPIVVVMGHVDHGKTSILDRIRHSDVTSTEAGGITQHIGAYQVTLEDGRNITFLDTPGHEAFTAMRSRGALATDIAILVVAADDGIMPQTVESINHAKAAGVSIIVAINKIDKEGANVERVKEQLTEYELVPEEWGGDVVCVPVSAKTGQGIDELLEMVLLTADVLELKANPNRLAKGTVIESRLDKGRGPIATLLVQNGTLKHGDVIIAGTSVGRVRAMINDKGMEVQTAGPCVPVEVTGLGEVPQAGDEFNAVENERLAKELVDKRKHEAKEEQFSHYQKVTLDNLFSQMEQGERKELDLVVKADVNGSVEAVKQSLEKLSNDEVRVRVIHGGVGAINRSDVMLAQASNAIIIGFNVRPDNTAKEMQAAGDVEIRLYRIIYDAIEDVEQAMKGMLEPKIREVALGQAEVREVYRITGVGTVAGCYVTEGKVARNALIRLVRDGVVLCEDKISSLKRFKDDQKEVAQGYECGIGLEKYNDIKVGDVFESFILEEYRD